MSEQTSDTGDRSPFFTFAVVADTHVNEDERTSTSPYEATTSPTPGHATLFAETAPMRPAPRFVVHLGDIAHPMPGSGSA